MDKEFRGKDAKDYDFWLQHERFLNNLDLATQNQANFTKVHCEMVRLYQESLVVTVAARLLRAKLIRELNKYNYL